MKLPWIILTLSCVIPLFAHPNNFETSVDCSYTKNSYEVLDNVHILNLEGSHYEMGFYYGVSLKTILQNTLAIIKNHFINEFGLTEKDLYDKAYLFHHRYSATFEPFLEGISAGAELSNKDIVLLNGMETLNSLKRERSLAHCAFISIPFQKTAKKGTLIGRNYDFFAPYDQCAENIVVAILKEPNKTPTAIIGMPGQIYCSTCINGAGLFLEFNNGTPSGGRFLDQNRQSLMIRLLEILQNSPNFNRLQQQLRSTVADYSLIVNAGSQNQTASFEFSSTSGMHDYTPLPESPFVSTNFFLSSQWQNLPIINDDNTWKGITRRDNLLHLANQLEDNANIEDIINIMNIDIDEGGARWDYTIYQIVFDTADFTLMITRPAYSLNRWTVIPLTRFFNN